VWCLLVVLLVWVCGGCLGDGRFCAAVILSSMGAPRLFGVSIRFCSLCFSLYVAGFSGCVRLRSRIVLFLGQRRKIKSVGSGLNSLLMKFHVGGL